MLYIVLRMLWTLTLLFIKKFRFVFQIITLRAGLGCWPVSPKASRQICVLCHWLARFQFYGYPPGCKGVWENDYLFCFSFRLASAKIRNPTVVKLKANRGQLWEWRRRKGAQKGSACSQCVVWEDRGLVYQNWVGKDKSVKTRGEKLMC